MEEKERGKETNTKGTTDTEIQRKIWKRRREKRGKETNTKGTTDSQTHTHTHIERGGARSRYRTKPCGKLALVGTAQTFYGSKQDMVTKPRKN